MNRIFFTLATVSNLALAWTFWLGWGIDDPRSPTVDWHFLTAVCAAVVALLVHAIALTYFMGTGRWIEETCDAYSLGPTARQENIRLKYRALPGMVGCILLVVVTGALGAMSDPAASIQWDTAPKVHLALAIVMLSANLLVSWVEYTAIARNGRVVDDVAAEVRRIRHERGLS